MGDSAISNPEADTWSQHSTEGPGRWWGEQSSATAVWMGMHCEGCSPAGLGQHFGAPAESSTSATHWCMFLKACELLCLIDPALSVSFPFFPFLFFSPWNGCTLTSYGCVFFRSCVILYSAFWSLPLGINPPVWVFHSERCCPEQ